MIYDYSTIERLALRVGVRIERLGLRLKCWAACRVRCRYAEREEMARPTDDRGRPV